MDFLFKFYSPLWEGSEDIPFNNTLRNIFVCRMLASVMSTMIVLLCGLDLAFGTADTQLENLNVIGVIRSKGLCPTIKL